MTCASLALLPALLLSALLAAARAAQPIHGWVALDPTQPTVGGLVRVAVLSRRSTHIETVALTPQGNFTLHALPHQSDDIYALHLQGTIRDEYAPLLVLLRAGHLAGVFSHANPLLIPPRPDSSAWDVDAPLHFEPVGRANYERRRRAWKLKDLWKWRYRFMQLAALGFVVWFPNVIRDLPPEMKEELYGEKVVDLGDPNAVVKGLLGVREVAAESESATRQ